MTRWRRLSLLFVFVAIAIVAALNWSRSIAESVPTTAPSISPQARELLDRLHTAYSSLKSLSVTGTMKANFDIDGVKADNTAKFNGLWAPSGLFRSEMSDGDTVVGNTGEKFYVFLPHKNRYDLLDAPKGPIHLDNLGDDITDLLCQQNLSLALALSADPAQTLARNASSIVRTKDVEIDGQSCPAITVAGNDSDVTLVVDPTSGLLRRSITDQTRFARAQGANDVKSALITTDFVNTPGAPAPDATFAWAPPPGAQPNATDTMGADIEGKPAPTFSLTGLDGKQVDSKTLKGSVFVLDFWASWCGPCVASLPSLDSVYKEMKDSGVRFYAINAAEEKETVQKFVIESKLSIPVLLDTDGKVLERYDTEGGIPFTVVVGKDGKVVKAGFFPDEEQIRPLIQAALKQ